MASIGFSTDGQLKINGIPRTFGSYNAYNLISGSLALGGAVDTAGMATTLYTGNGTGQSVVTGVDGATQWGNSVSETFGAMYWLKSRSGIDDNKIFDSIRGTGVINSNLTNAEATVGTIGITSTGFTPTGLANTNTTTYASWGFQTTHRITGTTNHGKAYTCHYNPFTGFTIVKYEGSGLAGHEIPHHLGRKLGFKSIKDLGNVRDWYSGGSVVGDGKELYLNLTNALTASTVLLSDTDNHSIISADVSINGNAIQYILYGWTNSYFDESNTLKGNYEVGVYQGTGAAGNKVTTRGKPAWVMTKRLDTTGHWNIHDNLRNPNTLYASANVAEDTNSAYFMTFQSDGFTHTGTGTDSNASGGQYLYMVVYDNDSGSGKSKYPRATDSSTLTLNATVPFAGGKDNNGNKNTVLTKNETITGLTLTQGKNYVYATNLGTYGVSAHRPRFIDTDFVRTYAGESPAVYNPNENQWYNSNAGSELVTNGTFTTDITGWTNTNTHATWTAGGVVTLEYVAGGIFYRDVTGLVVGKKYQLSFILNDIDTADFRVKVSATTANNGEMLNKSLVLNTHFVVGINKLSYTFIADATTAYVSFSSGSGVGQTAIIDNVSVFEADIIPSTPITESRNYLDAIVYADAGGQPTYIEQLPKTTYFDEVKANEFKGKNACTAWVNFDGTTTPPTIRDSFNIKSVVRTGTGVYDIYFDKPMDNVNYCASGLVSHSGGNNDIQILSFSLHKASFAMTDNVPNNVNYVINNIQIFGGKQ